MRQRKPPGRSMTGMGKPGMPIEPRVSSGQSRATMTQSRAKLRLTIAKAWRDRRSDE